MRTACAHAWVFTITLLVLARVNYVVYNFVFDSSPALLRLWPYYEHWHIAVVYAIYTFAAFVRRGNDMWNWACLVLPGLLNQTIWVLATLFHISCARPTREEERKAVDEKSVLIISLWAAGSLLLVVQAIEATIMVIDNWRPLAKVTIRFVSRLIEEEEKKDRP
jgi:hypothetical protein